MKHLEVYTPEELAEMPTLSQGHFANLKVDTGQLRYWLSRMTKEDGEKNAVQVEFYNQKLGSWKEIHAYGKPRN